MDGSAPVVFSSVEGQRNLPRWFSTVFSIVSRVEYGALEFELADGRIFRAEGSQPGPLGRVVVKDPRIFARMVQSGGLGFSEAYLDDYWTTPDLQGVLDCVLLNNEPVIRGLPRSGLLMRLNRFRHWLNRNTRRQARKNIEAHYDLGNDFYRLWLDESMTYSSALFEPDAPNVSLQEAQRAKYAAICDRLDAPPGGHVLEIGCGWGGFAEFAAKERGLRVTGLTISPSQLAFARERIARAGLSDRVSLELRDYRDETGAYDGVASIEMFEAVGEKYWPAYFGAVRDRLKPGARAALQIITIADHLFDQYRQSVDFVQRYIFPGGMLPCQAALRAQTEQAGLTWVGAHEFGQSYSETLRRWRDSFNAVWPDIEEMTPTAPGTGRFDARFHRMWNFYLASCAACFLAGTTNVVHLELRRS